MNIDMESVNIKNIISDWEKLCRICLTDQAVLFPVFNIVELDEQYNMRYCEMLNTCSTIKVSSNDNFPQLICSLCITHMRHALEFRMKCQSSEMLLKELLHKKNDLNTVIKCEVIEVVEVKEASAETEYLHLVEAKFVPEVDEEENTKVKSNPILPTKKENIESNSIILKKVHSCPICEESCSYRELQSHKKTHPNTCWRCNINFKRVEEYKEHLKEHRKNNCSECGKVLKNKEFCCLQKRKPVRTILNSSSRIKKVHSCPICHKSYKYIELLAHKKTHLNTCWKCNINFKSAEEHEEHFKEHEENVCSECGKVFRNKRRCNLHKIIHAKDKCLCTICGKKFNSLTNLAAHHRKHTAEPKRYACSYCGKKFTGWSGRRNHIRNHHTLEKPFACEVCDKRFAEKRHLVGHLRTHTNEKPFACTMCDAKFNQISSLNRHMFKHTGEKRVFCTVCNKGFVTNHNLKVHMVTHTAGKNFVCSVCNKGFSQAHVLRTHMNTHADNACTRKTNVDGTAS